MYKYLFKKLEQAHGAFIENLIFIPNEMVRPTPSDAFEEFQNNKRKDICKTLDWREEVEVYEMVESNIDDKTFAHFISEAGKDGFIAECFFPESLDFRFNKNGEISSWTVNRSYCRIVWIYADSMGELVDKIIEQSDIIFDEAVEEFKKKNNIKQLK